MSNVNFSIGLLEPEHDVDAFVMCPGVLGNPYQHHGCFTAEELVVITAAEIRTRLSGEEISAFVCLAGERVIALCVCSSLEWDSSYFEVPMARLEMWRLAGVDEKTVFALVEMAIQDATSRFGVKHIHARVGADDYELVNALMSSGFCLRDAQRVYVATGKRKNAPKKEIYDPHPYCADMRPALLDLFSDVVFDSRYTRDKTLLEEKTKKMYMQWVSTLVGLSEFEREIYVLERNGGVVAAGAGRYVDLSKCGVHKKIMTDGIFASKKGFSGAYISITKAVVDVALDNGCSFVELKVSENNHPANRVLQSLGYEGIPLFYYFHKAF